MNADIFKPFHKTLGNNAVCFHDIFPHFYDRYGENTTVGDIVFMEHRPSAGWPANPCHVVFVHGGKIEQCRSVLHKTDGNACRRPLIKTDKNCFMVDT